MSSQARVIVIGLDSAAKNQLLSRMESGEMPNLRSLFQHGCHGFLQTPEGMGDDAVWLSFYTACNPGRHGRYFFRQLTQGAYQTHKFQDA